MEKFLLTLLIFFTSLASAQQNYSANSAFDCETNEESAFLYTCNGQNSHCQAFLIFKSQPFRDSVATISALLSADKQDLASINGVKPESKFPLNKEVIVPVNCSCLDQFYQANSTFRVMENHSTYYVIATQTFQGLATCASLKTENSKGEFDLDLDQELRVPLRCACPTPNQIKNETSFLLTYPVNEGDSVPDIAERFNVSSESVMDANNLGENSVIFTETTILIPLADKPTSLKTIVHTEPPSVSPSLPYSPERKRSKRKVYEMVGISAACLFLVAIIVSVMCLFHKERQKKLSERSKEMETKFSGDLRVEIASVEYSLKVFGVKEILKATGNFSSEHRIKGSVYWGDFGGEILAVKKMTRDVSKEVNILKRLNHFNLIKILGVCENLGCFYLVFEHMESGSLRNWLNSSEAGNWRKRVQIAVDIANGLHYLHSFTQPGCVHKDIKSSNILLDRNLRAKISNFGFARGTANIDTTKRVEGTRGYMAPEYLQLGQVTPKIDVYAFGVLILELVTGKEAVFIQDGSEFLLSKAVSSIMQKENAETELISFIDFSLNETRERNLAVKLAKVGVICLTREPARRPAMEEVVSMLLRIQAELEKSKPSNAAAAPMWRSSIGETNVRDEFISM